MNRVALLLLLLTPAISTSAVDAKALILDVDEVIDDKVVHTMTMTVFVDGPQMNASNNVTTRIGDECARYDSVYVGASRMDGGKVRLQLNATSARYLDPGQEGPCSAAASSKSDTVFSEAVIEATSESPVAKVTAGDTTWQIKVAKAL